MAAVQLLAVTARSPDTLRIFSSTTAGASWTALPMTLAARRLSVTTFADRDECDNLSWNLDRSILAVAGTASQVRFLAVNESGADVLKTALGATITINAGTTVISVGWHPRLDRLYVGLNASPWVRAYDYNRATRAFSEVTLPLGSSPPTQAVKTWSFTRTGSHVAVRDRGVYRLSATGSATFQTGSPDGGFGALAFSPNGEYLISDDTLYSYTDGGGLGDSWSEIDNFGHSATIQRAAFNLLSTRVLISNINVNYVHQTSDGGLIQTLDPAVSGYSDIQWESDGLGFLIAKTNAGSLYRYRPDNGAYADQTIDIPDLVLVNTAGTSDIQLAPSIHSVVLGKYVEPGYGAAGYFNDGTIVGLNSFAVSGTLAELGEVPMVATSTVSVSADKTLGGSATLAALAAVLASGGRILEAGSNLASTATHTIEEAVTRGGSAAVTALSEISAQAGYQQSAATAISASVIVSSQSDVSFAGSSSMSSTATQVAGARVDYDESLDISGEVAVAAQAQQTHRPTVALSGAAQFALSADVLVLQDGLLAAEFQFTAAATATLAAQATLATVATLAAEARFPVQHEALADLEITVSQNTLGGRLIEPNEVSDYDWDELSQWVEWPFEKWEPRGVFMLVSGGQLTLAGNLPTGEAALTAEASLGALGGYQLDAQSALPAISNLVSGSAVARPAAAALQASTTVEAVGVRTKDIELALFGAATVTASAVMITQGVVVLQAQSTTTAVPAFRPGGSATMAAQAVQTTSGHYLRLAEANLAAFYATLTVATIFKVDNYRLAPVARESRIWVLPEETRQAPVPQNQRQYRVEGHLV